MEFLKRLWNDEEGQGMVEYALIIALVAIVVAAFFPPVTNAISGLFTRIAGALNGTATPPSGG